MKMVYHADEQIQPDVVLLNAFCKTLKKPLPISVVTKQTLFRNPARAAAPRRERCFPHHSAGHMINRAGKLNSKMPRHESNMTRLLTVCTVYCEGLTLIPAMPEGK